MTSSRPIKSRKFNVSEEYAGNNRVYEALENDADKPGWTDFKIERKDGESHLQYAQRSKNAAQEIRVLPKPEPRPWGERFVEGIKEFVLGSKSVKEKGDTKKLSKLDHLDTQFINEKDRLVGRLKDKKNQQDASDWIGTVQTTAPPPKQTRWQRFKNLFFIPPDPKDNRKQLPIKKDRKF